MDESLRKLQTLLYDLITAPEGVRPALKARAPGLPAGGLGEIICGDERLGATDRLGIYADAYFYRLLQCLKVDFPGVAGAIGERRFHKLIRDYLAAYPPFHTSIAYAGRFLADFLRDHRLRRSPFLADFARLEWTLSEVFQDPDAVTLASDDLRAIPPGQWPSLRLRTPPALRLVECRWRVCQTLRAIREGRDWETPEPGEGTVLVWRADAVVYYRELAREERGAFALLVGGATFSAVCEAVAQAYAEGDPVEEINRLLARWVGDGCLMLEQETASQHKSEATKRPKAESSVSPGFGLTGDS